MNYRVVWRDRLRNGLHLLTHLTLEYGGDPAGLAQAVEEINLRLSDNPADEGESREGGERILIVNPLSVYFEVFETAQTVMIYTAVYYPRTRL